MDNVFHVLMDTFLYQKIIIAHSNVCLSVIVAATSHRVLLASHQFHKEIYLYSVLALLSITTMEFRHNVLLAHQSA
jgi:hypothetical protein